MRSRKNKIPLFLSAHPLRLESHLKYHEFNPFFYSNDRDITFIEIENSVTLFLSLFDIEPFIHKAIDRYDSVPSIRLAVIASRGELKFFAPYKTNFTIYRKRAVEDFIPAYVDLNLLPKESLFWKNTASVEDPIIELDISIGLTKRLLNLGG